ncbi:MAG: hypothetical protein ACN6OC_05110 [Alcaligenes sp.]
MEKRARARQAVDASRTETNNFVAANRRRPCRRDSGVDAPCARRAAGRGHSLVKQLFIIQGYFPLDNQRAMDYQFNLFIIFIFIPRFY